MKIGMMCLWNAANGPSIHAELVGRAWVKLGLLEKTFQTICGFVGGKLESLIIPLAGRSGDIKSNVQAKEKAIAFGQRLVS